MREEEESPSACHHRYPLRNWAEAGRSPSSKGRRAAAFRLLVATAFLAFLAGPLLAKPAVVQKTGAGWSLLVDDSSFTVKGVGSNVADGPSGEDYLALARDMGANTVRTWGITPRSYFDRAHEYGLQVNAGVWFNAIRGAMTETYTDPDHRARLKAETLAHVREMKDHPALLMWNLGNEVFAFTESEEEKEAFGLFLEDLIRAVHKEDPDHPVVYAAAGHRDLPYLQKYIPSLDIVGINVYGPFGYVMRWMEDNDYDRPVVVTEFGPFGAWERMKDPNDLAYDDSDHIKAAAYRNLWRDIEQNPDVIGGFAFVIGDQRNQNSLSWWNLNWKNKKRAGYWAMYEAYTGKEPANASPKIRHLAVETVSNLKPGETITLTVKADDPDGDAITYDYFITDLASDPLIVEPPRFYPARAKSTGPGHATVAAPNEPGLYRVYAIVDDGQGNVAIANRSIEVAAE